MNSLRRLFARLNNIRRWIPILWDDFDWDFGYVYLLWAAKFGFMAEYFREQGYGEDAEESAEQLEEAQRLCLILADDPYDAIFMKETTRKWGEAEWIVLGDHEKGFRKLKVTWPGVKTEEDEKRLQQDVKRALEDAEFARQRDQDRLFDLLLDHLDEWWD